MSTILRFCPLLVISVFLFSCGNEEEGPTADNCRIESWHWNSDEVESFYGYEYNSENQVSSVSYTSDRFDQESTVTAQITYDDDGRITRIFNDSDNYTELTYRSGSILIRIERSEIADFEGEYILDDNGTILSLDYAGLPFERYEYNSKGHLTKVFRYYLGREYLLYERTYDDMPNPLQGLPFFASDISLQGVLYKFIEFDMTISGPNNLTSTTVYNREGEVISEGIWTYQYGNNGLPVLINGNIHNFESTFDYLCQ